MITFSEGLKMFSFSVMKLSFCFSCLKTITVPAANQFLRNDLRSTLHSEVLHREGPLPKSSLS